MLVKFTSLFDIYPDKLRKGAVVGYRKADGTPLEFPCTIDTGDAVKDAKGRWTASALGLKPVVAKYTGALKRTEIKEAWVGNEFSENPYAWDMDDNIESVRFVDGVTSIGTYAFACCEHLTDIIIPNTVTSIGSYAFRYCTALTDITISEGVTSIGDWAFHGCSSLTIVTIPDSVTEIGDFAFKGCFNLTAITIPESVTSIGSCAFYGCTNLTDVYVDQPKSDLLNNLLIPERCTVHRNQAEAV